MEIEFEKIKKRFLISAIIKCVICGAAAGLFAAGAVLLGLKLAETEINAGFYVLIGAGIAAAVGGALFLFLRPTDKKAAKRLDDENRLNERVQTMVAFAGEDGDIYELQRRDALEKLAALPARKPDVKKLWQYAAAIVVALALFITAVAIPAKADPAVTDRPFEYSERQRAAVEQLISDVEESSLGAADKSTVTAVLAVMSDNLAEAKKESEMKAAVLSSVALIDLTLYTPNSFDNVAFALGEDKKTEFLAAAMTDGVLFYKASATQITSLEQVRKLERELGNSVGEKVDMDMDVFIQQYGVLISEGLKDTLDSINELMSYVFSDKVAEEDDPVRVSVESFAAEMTKLAQDLDGFDDEAAQKAVKDNITALKNGLVPALCPQSYKCIADEFVRRRLAQIFGLNPNELPRQNSGVQELDERPDNKDDDDDTHGGGIGKGEAVFGSTEFVYDPDTGELTAYGQYINRYYANMSEQLLSGEVPENLQESIKKYFSILYSGTEQPEEENKKD